MTAGPAGEFDLDLPPPGRIAGRATGWWGMVTGLVALASMHSTLLFAHVYLAARAQAWPPAGTDAPGLVPASIATAVLMLSGVAGAVAHSAAGTGGTRRLQAATAVTALLGAVFVTLAVGDLRGLELEMRAHVYDATFVVFWAFAIFMIAIGIAGLVFIQFQLWGARLDQRQRLLAVNAALWWYFAIGCWLAVYGTLYLGAGVWR
jgi:heme/copper-type cytochrome/quinol oxidase subunit 3